MARFLLLALSLVLIGSSHQSLDDNEVDETNPFLDIAGSLLAGGDKSGDLGSLVSNFLDSEGGKQMGQMLMSGGAAGGAGQILQGIGALMGQNAGGGGIDLSMIGNVIGMLNQGGESGKKSGGFDISMIGNLLSMMNQGGGEPAKETRARKNEGFDLSSAMNLASSFMSQEGSSDMTSYLPVVMNLFNSFVGPEAEERAHSHADHAWYLPPIVEKLHVFFDQFLNSDMGKGFVTKLGAEKFMKIFSDGEGNFSVRKFVDLLENRSFRRHWIKIVTGRLAEMLSFMADPYTQKKYLSTGQFFVNNFLKGQGVPKSALFDPKRPTESIAALINYFPMKYMNLKMDSMAAIKPAVEYAQELIRLAENKGFLGRAIDSTELTHKLTDTINLEILEPIARVNRAMRFAQKIPECSKYVFCLANEHEDHENLSLPGLKRSLSKGATFIASWYLSSGNSNSEYMNIYMETVDGQRCKSHYTDKCEGFHLEELKVTTEYVHNEL